MAILFNQIVSIAGDTTSNIDVQPPSGEIWIVKRIMVLFGAGDGTYAAWCRIYHYDGTNEYREYSLGGSGSHYSIIDATSGPKNDGGYGRVERTSPFIANDSLYIRIIINNRDNVPRNQYIVVEGVEV